MNRRTSIISLGVLVVGLAAVWLDRTRMSDLKTERAKPSNVSFLQLPSSTASGAVASDIGQHHNENNTSGPADSIPIMSTDHVYMLIRNLRAAATNVADVQSLCIENAPIFEELQSLGIDAVNACRDEIADRTSPIPLRIILIEIASALNDRSDQRLGQLLMSLVRDDTEMKAVRMQALQWIPQTADQSAGTTLVQMLLKERDPDLEFGITRALRGFKVPESIEVLKGELAEDKGHLIRIAASHAIAAQGGPDALALLQASVSTSSTAVVPEEQPEEVAVSMHGVIALGEIPDASSLPILEGILSNSGNSVHIRSKAAESIATINGASAAELLRRELRQETNESLVVYLARGLLLCGDETDSQRCLLKAESTTDSYAKSELKRVAHELQRK